MSTRKKADESADGTVTDYGTNDPTLPPVEALLPVATDTPSDGQAVAAESITATAQDIQPVEVVDGPITGDGSSEACPPIKALWIRAVPKQGFRRCGFFFPYEGVGIALSALTEDQIEQLRREPNLVMELSEFSDSLEG